MNLENILDKPEFNMISKKLKVELIALDSKLNGKNDMERMKCLVDFYNINLKNVSLNPEEEKAMFLAITNSLGDNEKQQFEMMYKLLLKHKFS